MSDVVSEEAAGGVIAISEMYEEVDTSSLVPNDWNPNFFPDNSYEALKADIAKCGSNKDQPVIVRPHPTQAGKYEIIDGAHRHRAVSELGIPKTVVTILPLDDKAARLKTISMNRLRGDFDRLALAKLIAELRTGYNATEGELTEALGYTPEEIRDFESSIKFDFKSYQENAHPGTAQEEIPVMENIDIMCNQKEFEAIHNLTSLLDIPDMGEAVAVAALHLAFLKQNSQLDPDDVAAAAEQLSSPEDHE